MKINVLDSSIYNHISAGEVVEKPASIVKELVENSIDANATAISIDIVKGGIDYICVTDNGTGIEYDEVDKVFLPHATSKVSSLKDLEAISTLGFRGEAMASIASVARVTLMTQTANGHGCEIKINGGVTQSKSPISMNTGTSVAVENLFFNTPVRLKFLRKAKMEENDITQLVSRFIFSHPHIKFDYTIDGHKMYSHYAGELFSAMCCVYGLDITQNVVKVDYSEGDVKVSGFVSKIGFSKPNKTYQTAIINGRCVSDEIVSKAVFNALEDYLMTRQYPVFILNIDMPIDQVDVNVHPSKLNVRFADPEKITNIVMSAIRQAIFSAHSDFVSNSKASEEVKQDLPVIPDGVGKSFMPEENSSIQPVEQEPKLVEAEIIDYNPINPTTIMEFERDDYIRKQVSMAETMPTDTKSKRILDGDVRIIGEIFQTYIIIEKNNEMWLIDFHAAHERLNYDRFCKIMEDKQLATQDLLMPYTHRVNASEMNYLLSIQEQLREIGFELDQFGNDEIKISSVPVLLKDVNLKEFVDDLLFNMKLTKNKTPYQIKTYLMQSSCKNAVKSGFNLSAQEIDELLGKLGSEHPVLLCPHGRPIIYKVARSTIDKWFKRIV